MTSTTWPQLEHALRAAGRTRGWLADQLGIHRRTLANWEHGHTRLRTTAIPEIAKLLHVDEADLAPTGIDVAAHQLPAEWAPHCELLDPVEPGTPEWVAQRSAGIDCAELAGVLGVSGALSPMSIWLAKTSATPETPEGNKWDRRQLPYLLADIETAAEVRIAPVGAVISTRHRWLQYQHSAVTAQTGLIVHALPGTLRRPPRTLPAATAADPLYVQLQGAMIVTGAPAAIVAWIDRRGESRHHTVAADTDMQERIIAAGEDLWRHITDRTLPELDGLQVTAEALDLLHGTALGAGEAVVDVDGAAAEWAARHQYLTAHIEQLQTERDQIANQLRALAGDRTAILDERGVKIISLTPDGIHEDRLVRDYPTIAAEVVTEAGALDVQLLAQRHPEIAQRLRRTRIETRPAR
ncbi:helix-turn-helix domain-containing protein [Gordonia alkaliphila]|uniref:helix-turn-helix domain-containing protein n=1 Tax=Gordonia alkaliphila TaxID=1053547 RepID=UPI001FF390AB|nr:helix-turn-helix domain-containing protein [Gordonia alkaliphila]MCK0441100.1 helix-turn-helix domain-containing protein [Gordonia alkaliphila]